MMKSAANVRAFLAKLDEASRDGAKREHALVLEFARGRQPGLSEIDITSRGYWYEQFRRARFDFDSQSVRPYFPYAQVEAGVLETAAKLFKVEFRPSNAPAWHPAVSVFEVFDGGRHGGPVLSRHASARGQGQVVFCRAGGDGRARAHDAGGCADLQFSGGR